MVTLPRPHVYNIPLIAVTIVNGYTIDIPVPMVTLPRTVCNTLLTDTTIVNGNVTTILLLIVMITVRDDMTHQLDSPDVT